MTVKETLDQLEKHLKITIGSSTSITTWKSAPLLCVTYDDQGFVPFDLEDRRDFDMDVPPSDQIISLCYQKQPLISTYQRRRNELLYWLEELIDEENQITNSEILDYVWTKQNIARLSRVAHERLQDVNAMRHDFALYGEVFQECE